MGLLLPQRSAREGQRDIVLPGLRALPDVPRNGPWDKEFAQHSNVPPGYILQGAPTVLDCNKTVPGCLYLKHGNGNVRYMVMWPSPPAPFTVIGKISMWDVDPSGSNASQQPGLTISTAATDTTNQRSIGVWAIGDGTANSRPQIHGTSIAQNAPQSVHPPFWLKLVVNSNTSVDGYISWGGRLWIFVGNINPGFTVGSFGVSGVVTGSSPASNAAAWEYLRVTTP